MLGSPSSTFRLRILPWNAVCVRVRAYVRLPASLESGTAPDQRRVMSMYRMSTEAMVKLLLLSLQVLERTEKCLMSN